MKIDVITAFEEMIDHTLSHSIVGRARKAGIIKLGTLSPREFAEDKHKTIDDRPYGGGPGMLMKAEPLYQAISKLRKKGSYVILTSPRGQVFNQELAKKLAKKRHLIFVCGHYEGIDARIYPEVDLEVSLGDFILTGGELAACVMIDAITRLRPGTFKKEGVTSSESFEGHLLEAPQYTRPEVWRGRKVPAVLLNGNHKEIEAWKHEQALALTKQLRPDLLENASQKSKKVQKKKIRRK
ncbi:tRNA (guanosine(37)-N1)-methyltransferase TrmD [Candidatus Avelusimicrobium gallicola]|uniref:tRNA (guanine-N(1)-)-methyltransferase n=1 Tax=Candidatus Avelusimicrobium gallicola TaxID=2562704 RepID=A0A1Y4DDQ7_9BACT|nr:tRNA (guanosine(37)-N1)-methyltransferase TrmD [Elusimicrobium sp. An273]OUO57253.1 tRNA (guanosine(37)-N1)-methyltransferase TrmD [Elusimicrobium sp. An273]